MVREVVSSYKWSLSWLGHVWIDQLEDLWMQPVLIGTELTYVSWGTLHKIVLSGMESDNQ